MGNETVLEMRNISKSFPGVQALDGVSISVRRGRVLALMGENGAGKSTLMKCLFGIYSQDSGEIFLDGKEVKFKSSREALDGGVAMVHQELELALKRSVADNIWLGRYPKAGPFVSERRLYNDTCEIFSRLGLSISPKKIMETMPASQRQMVEIAKAVSYNAKVIVFDEPTSSLSDKEVEKLFSIIEKLKADGCAIIYISHKMEEILKIADDVAIMRDGRHIATEAASEMTMEKIIKLMVGREITNRFPERERNIGDELLRVEELSSKNSPLTDVSFSLGVGEVVGVAGLDGSGRTELLENLFGIAERKGGNIFLKGKKIKNKTAREAIRNGFAFLTEERRRDGIFSILDIRENMLISSKARYCKWRLFLDAKRMRKVCDEMISSLRIKTPSQKTKIRSLSGGNQQKVIFGRWLLTEPTILLLDEPTRGIDVGAKYEIYNIIGSLAAEGRGVIMVSSEMPELLGVCDRILVMSGGRLAGVLDAKSATQEEIMRLATKYV